MKTILLIMTIHFTSGSVHTFQQSYETMKECENKAEYLTAEINKRHPKVKLAYICGPTI